MFKLATAKDTFTYKIIGNKNAEFKILGERGTERDRERERKKDRERERERD
jgi:hypothetical protein